MINLLKKFFGAKKAKGEIQTTEKYSEKPTLTQETSFKEQIYSIEKNYEDTDNINFVKYQIQIINSKLDAISAKMDSLIMKINYLENIINSFFYRR